MAQYAYTDTEGVMHPSDAAVAARDKLYAENAAKTQQQSQQPTQRERSQPSYTAPTTPYAGTGTTYGLAADVALNKGAKLYTPGVTQLGTKDVFLGGTGTGITNDMLGGATRVYGNTAQDTANAYSKYLSSQLPKTPTAQYVTNPKGQTTSQYSQGTSTYNVLPGSVQDPLSKNYNALVANSNGKITLADLDSSSPTGLSPAYNGTPGSGSPTSPGYAIRAAGGVYQPPTAQATPQTQPRSEYQSQSQYQPQQYQQPLQTQSQYPSQPYQSQQVQPSQDPLLSIIGNDPEAMAYYNRAKQTAQLGSRNAMETLNQRGILNSSVTGDTVTELEQQAMTGILPQLYSFQEQKKQAAKQDAYNRMNMLGYADNEVSKTLGIPVGTPSASYSMQEAGLTGIYKGQPTMANAYQEAGLTGQYKGTQTMAAQNQQASLTGRIGGTQTSTNDYILGGTAVILQGTPGIRLAGYTAEDTERAIQEAASDILARSSQVPVTIYYGNEIDKQNAQKYLGNSVNYQQWNPGQQTLASQGFDYQKQQDQLARDYQQQGFDTDTAIKLAQLDLQKQELSANTAYKNASLAKSGSSGASIAEQKYANERDSVAATAEAFDVLNNLANQGKTRSEIFKALKDNYSTFANGNVDMDKLWKMADDAFQWDG